MVLAIEIIDSIGFVVVSDRRSVGLAPSRATVNILAGPSNPATSRAEGGSPPNYFNRNRGCAQKMTSEVVMTMT